MNDHQPARSIDLFQGLPWGSAANFLGLDPALSDWNAAAAVVVPVPYESTVSYQGGTRRGPAAIIEASRYVEWYDHELDGEPVRHGVATLPELHLSSAGPERAHQELRDAYEEILVRAGDKLLIVLGGEHSISSAPILAHAARQPEGRRLSVLQFDAHADLRPEYEGSPWSHASVMARVVDDVDLVQVGIRALTAGERALIRSRPERITTVFAEQMWRDDAWVGQAFDALGDDVYITFDVDYFDPSLMPATGTPEPGGPAWYPTLRLLERVFTEKRVVGVDVVELAPIGGNAAPDFAVARLIYKMIGYATRPR